MAMKHNNDQYVKVSLKVQEYITHILAVINNCLIVHRPTQQEGGHSWYKKWSQISGPSWVMDLREYFKNIIILWEFHTMYFGHSCSLFFPITSSEIHSLISSSLLPQFGLPLPPGVGPSTAVLSAFQGIYP